MDRHESNPIDRTINGVVIRKYGLLPPINWSDDCDSELTGIDEFWNVLVSIHEKYTGLYLDKLSEDAEFRTAKEWYDGVVKSGSKPFEESAARKNLAIVQKSAGQHFAAELRELELARREEVKVARQNSGLWWGNYNALVRSFERARSAAVRSGGVLRRRFGDADSRITNTLQGGASVEALFDGSLSQVLIAPIPHGAWHASTRGERRRLQRTKLTATVFVRAGERRSVTWPMIMHREIPSDCRVKELVITRRRIVDKWEWAAIFLCTRISEHHPELDAGHELTAIDLGWRRTAEGLRVATVMHLGEEAEFLNLPKELLSSFAFVDELKARLQASSRGGLELLQNLDAANFECPYRSQLTDLQTREEGKFRELGAFIRSEFFTAQSLDSLPTELRQWRSQHKKLQMWLRNHQRKVIARRNHIYQNVAHRLAGETKKIIINDINLEKIASRINTKSTDMFFPAKANYYRVVAASGEFVRCLKLQAAKRGVTLEMRKVSMPLACPKCGTSFRSSRQDSLVQRCATCETAFDQDVALCNKLLEMAGGI